MGILSGNPKHEPMHYGEIYDIWQNSMAAKGCISSYRALQYHAGDKELQQILVDVIELAETQVRELDKLLVENGITPAPALPERPKAKLEDIPAGARFTDQEIAPMVAADMAAGLVTSSQIMGKCIREDIGALFAKYHAQKAVIGLKVLRLSKEKGWLIPPPLEIRKPELAQV
jgi:hypothetical protein